MGYDLYRIKLVYSVVRTVAIPMLKSFLQGFDISGADMCRFGAELFTFC